MAGQVALTGHSFPRIAAPRYDSTWQFILALNGLNTTSDNTHQILLKIPGAAYSPLPKIQKPVLPHENLSGLLGWLWKWTGLKRHQTR